MLYVGTGEERMGWKVGSVWQDPYVGTDEWAGCNWGSGAEEWDPYVGKGPIVSEWLVVSGMLMWVHMVY